MPTSIDDDAIPLETIEFPNHVDVADWWLNIINPEAGEYRFRVTSPGGKHDKTSRPFETHLDAFIAGLRELEIRMAQVRSELRDGIKQLKQERLAFERKQRRKNRITRMLRKRGIELPSARSSDSPIIISGETDDA